MKRFIFLMMIASFWIAGASLASELSGLQSLEERMGIAINGEIKVQAKYQDSFKTPFDHPEWDNHTKSGANHRSDQNIRSKGYLTFSFGDIGRSEWFGIVETSFDANRPDSDTGEESEAVFEPFFLSFIMYRPFVINGGRPLGLSLGIQSIPATINGYYSHIFAGDVDFDFAANLSSALTSMPAVTLDFHVKPDTGIGVTWARGCSYASEAAAFVHPESASTLALWLEGKKGGLGLNAAMQWVAGNRGSTAERETNNGNTYNEYSGHTYRHRLFNTLLSYTFTVYGTGIMPYIGYQSMGGDETPLPRFSDEEATIQDFDYSGYGAREFKGNLKTAGITLTRTLFGKQNELALEFTKVDIPDFDGIGGLKKGSIDQFIQRYLQDNKTAFNEMAKKELGLPAEMEMDMTGLWSKSPLAGFSKTIYNFADIDFVVNAEHTITLTDRIKMGAFAYSLKAKDDKTLGNTSYIKSQLEKAIAGKMVREIHLDSETSEDLAKAVVAAMEAETVPDTGLSYISYIANDTRPAEWTDTWAMGLFITYSF